VASCYIESAFALDVRVFFPLNTRMPEITPTDPADSVCTIKVTPELLGAAGNVKSAHADIDINLAQKLNLDSFLIHFRPAKLLLTDDDRAAYEILACNYPKVIDEYIAAVLNSELLFHWLQDSPFKEENLRPLGQRIELKMLEQKQLCADIKEKRERKSWGDVAVAVIQLINRQLEIGGLLREWSMRMVNKVASPEEQQRFYLILAALDGTPGHDLDFDKVKALFDSSIDEHQLSKLLKDQSHNLPESIPLKKLTDNSTVYLSYVIMNRRAGTGEYLINKPLMGYVRKEYRAFLIESTFCHQPAKDQNHSEDWVGLQRNLARLFEAQKTFLSHLFSEKTDSTTKQDILQLNAAEYTELLEQINRSLEQLKATGTIVSSQMGNSAKQLEATGAQVSSEIGDNVKLLQASSVELKEAAAPFREMYKDERLCKAKSEALRADVPELVVDAIVSEQYLSKFPSSGRLMKYLYETGGMKKLENAGRGISRPTIARWLGTVRNIMVKLGLVERYRVRVENIPKDRISPAEAEDNPPKEEEMGPINDTSDSSEDSD
jgi:hypothetical protein